MFLCFVFLNLGFYLTLKRVFAFINCIQSTVKLVKYRNGIYVCYVLIKTSYLPTGCIARVNTETNVINGCFSGSLYREALMTYTYVLCEYFTAKEAHSLHHITAVATPTVYKISYITIMCVCVTVRANWPTSTLCDDDAMNDCHCYYQTAGTEAELAAHHHLNNISANN